METLLRDLGYAFRSLRHSLGFTAVAIVTLALGIGANAAMFSLVNDALLRPLPIEAPERTASLWDARAAGGYSMFSYPNYVDLRDRTETFSGLVARKILFDLHLSTGASRRPIGGALVSANYFEVLGVNPRLGRGFLPEEDRTVGTHPVTVISHDLWRNDFGSDPGIVGETLILNGYPFTIVGVAPEGFQGTRVLWEIDVYVPFMMYEQATPQEVRGGATTGLLENRRRRWIFIVGRLAPGVSIEQAQAEMNTLARQLAQAYPEVNEEFGVNIVKDMGYSPQAKARLTTFSAFMMAITGLVALIACANVTSMLLANAVGRRKEVAVRLAVGCSRARLVRQLLTESLVLAVIGGAFGLLLGYFAADLLLANLPFAPNAIYDWDWHRDATPDGRVLGFTLALALLTGIIFGLAPAMRCSKPDLVPSLKEVPVVGGNRRFHVRTLLVIGQVAICLVLLISATLFIRSFEYLIPDDPGFDTDNVLLVTVDLDLQGYDGARGEVFYDQLFERIRAFPGVESVSLGVRSPGMRAAARSRLSPGADGTVSQPYEESPGVPTNLVGPGYLRTAGIPLVAGREFQAADEATDASVVVVNETVARELWPDKNPIGRQLVVRLPPWMEVPERVAEVVGVARDSVFGIFTQEPRWLSEAYGGRAPFLYVPLHWSPGVAVQERAIVHVRTDGDPMGLVPAIEREVNELDRDLPVRRALTVADSIGEALEPQRMAMSFTIVFGLLAAFLAAVGVYSVMANAVYSRAHEIGVRLALGAPTRDIVGLVIRQGMLATVIGVAIGIAAALALTRVISTYIFGVSSTDPVSFLIVSAFLVLVALLASFIPARRATRVDPLLALRSE